MKKIFIFAACAGLLLSSCNDFLKEDTDSILTGKDFNKTDNHFLGQVNYLYRNGSIEEYSSAGSAYIGPFASVTAMLTGYFRNSYEGQENVCQYARELERQGQTNNVSGTMDGVWDNCYDAINVANSVINNIANPEVAVVAANKEQYIAEAKFFRAQNYFYLVKTFGDVPLSMTAYSSADDDMMLPRTAKAEVMKQVVQDLKDAVSVLKADTWQNAKHRITKYVAEMALTDVYMYQGDYTNAAAMAQDIINSGKYQLTENSDRTLGSAYNKLRTTDDLPEVIYAQEFDNTIATSGWWPTYAFTSSATGTFNKYAITERVFGPYGRYLNIYTADDLRGQEKQFFATSYTNVNYEKDGKKEPKTWTMPTQQGVANTDPAYYDQIGCWYYFDQNAMEITGRGTKDWNIYRYAETLLDAAEAIAQTTGVTAEAAGYLAQVQSRALGKSVAQLTSSLQSLSKQAFIEACWTERLREFPLEFKIWDDCVRTGKFPVIDTAMHSGKVTYVDLIGATNGSGAVFKQTDLLWPISLNEIQRNPNLTQNEGYQKSNSGN
jgi:hypothetical protein